MTDPEFTIVPRLDASCRDEVVRHWMAVNDADGAVGFQPGASYDEVAAALARHEREMDEGRGVLAAARDREAGGLVGFGWWIRGLYGPESSHVATLKRLQVHPSRQGSGLGGALMDYLHSPDVLALVPGVEFLHLQYRTGRGLCSWYERFGYREIARFDVFRKEADGTYGGWGEMLRRVDGSPLPERSPRL